MNLYRSFGNLMEAWVNEGGQYPDPPAPSSAPGDNLRSDSVDSGVETASSVTSPPATPCFLSPDNVDPDAFMPETRGPGLSSASAPQSPVPLSSSSSLSPRLLPSDPRESPAALSLKLERALRRVDSKLTKDNLTTEAVLRQRPLACVLPKRHVSELLRGQRSQSYGPRRSTGPSEMCKRPSSLRCDKQRSEWSVQESGEEEWKGLSPGLRYLEQVCQTLEEFARQQMQSRASQIESDAAQEHWHAQAPDSCRSHCEAAEENLSSCPRLEPPEYEAHCSSEHQQRRNNPSGHFRQRSASDTTMAALHLRQVSSDCRGQHLSTCDMLEKMEEVPLNEKPKKEGSTRTLTLKFGSLRGDESSPKVAKGQQMQSSERNSARRRLSQLFRRRGKTMPA